MKSSQCLFTLFFLLFFNFSFAQKISIEYADKSIYDIDFQDSLLWQATQKNLYKRDARSGELLESMAIPTGSSNVYDMANGIGGDIWIAMGKAGIACHHASGQWQVWDSLNTPAFRNGIQIGSVALEAGTGYIWATAYHPISGTRQVFYFDGQDWKKDENVLLSRTTLTRFAESANGAIAFYSNDTLLYRQNGQWKGLQRPSPYTRYESVSIDQNATVWYTDAEKLYQYKNIAKNPTLIYKYPNPQNQISALCVSRNGTIYLGIYNKGMVEWTSNGVSTYPTTPSINGNAYITGLKEAPDGRIWIVHNDYPTVQFLSIWDKQKIVKNLFVYVPEYGPMAEDSKGNIWFAGEGRFFTQLKQGEKPVYYALHGLLGKYPRNEFCVLKAGPNGTLWFLDISNQALLWFDGQNWSTVPISQFNYINHIRPDYHGNLYTSVNGRVQKYNPKDKSWKALDLVFWNESLYVEEVIGTDHQDNLWLHCQYGLCKYSSKGAIEIFTIPQFGEVVHLQNTVTEDGKIVIMVFFNDEFFFFTFDDQTKSWSKVQSPSLINYNYDDILWYQDQKGNLWLSLITPFQIESKTWYYQNGEWTELLGLPQKISLTNINSDRNGNVYFCYGHILAKVSCPLPLATHDQPQTTTLSISPNPVFDTFHCTVPQDGDGWLDLSDIHGKVCYTEPVSCNAGTVITLYRRALPSGTYILTYRNQNGNMSSQKIVFN